MLFTDGVLLTEADLKAFDSETGLIDDQQVIDMTAVILESQREVALEILSWSRRFFGRTQSFLLLDDFSAQSRYNEAAERPKISLSQVVATDAEFSGMWTQIQRYLAATTLFNFFRNAARRSGGDRYADLRDYWRAELEDKYRPRLKQSGIPVVDYPLHRPGALFIPGAGVWSSANLTVSGTTADNPVRPVYVAITWVATSQLANNESAGADALSISAGSGQTITIAIDKLKAPDGSYSYASLARLAVPTLKATGWHVYAGYSADTLTRQTVTPVPLATKSYALDAGAISDTGEPLGLGQAPLYSMIVGDTFNRC